MPQRRLGGASAREVAERIEITARAGSADQALTAQVGADAYPTTPLSPVERADAVPSSLTKGAT